MVRVVFLLAFLLSLAGCSLFSSSSSDLPPANSVPADSKKKISTSRARLKSRISLNKELKNDAKKDNLNGVIPSPAQSATKPFTVANLVSGEAKPPTAEEADSQISKMGHDWLYGHGFGRTVTNVGAVVFFPPYAIYLLGNAALEVTGQDPLYITDALPEGPRGAWLKTYNEITGVPGRVSSGVAREEFEEETGFK